MNDDIETIRGFFGQRYVGSAVYAALDRLEAELTRLRDEIKEAKPLIRQLLAEIERLRAALDGCNELHALRANAEKIAQAENKRLRAEVLKLNDTLHIGCEAEVERLRAEAVTAKDEQLRLSLVVQQYVAEVERLRALVDKQLIPAQREVERLRKAARRHANNCVDPDAVWLERATELDRQLAETDVDDNHAEDLADQPTEEKA